MACEFEKNINIIVTNFRSCGDYTNYNGGYLLGSIRNDTHRDLPNNRNNNKCSLSPNNSIRSRKSSIHRHTPTPNQVIYLDFLLKISKFNLNFLYHNILFIR